MNLRRASKGLLGLCLLGASCSGLDADEYALATSTTVATTSTTVATTSTTVATTSTTAPPVSVEGQTQTPDELPRTGPNEVMFLIAIGCALLVGGRTLVDIVNAANRRLLAIGRPDRPLPPR